MIAKLLRLLRRQKRRTKMIGPAGTGKTMTMPGEPGKGGLAVPMTVWLPSLWRAWAIWLASRGWKPIIFFDDEGLNDIPLSPEDNAPQK